MSVVSPKWNNVPLTVCNYLDPRSTFWYGPYTIPRHDVDVKAFSKAGLCAHNVCVCVVVVVVYNSVARIFLREIKFDSFGASKVLFWQFHKVLAISQINSYTL